MTDGLKDRSARSLVSDVVGLYSRPIGGWMPVADVLLLLELLGVERAVTRTSISRMVRDHILFREVRDGVSGYGLAPEAIPAMERADRRLLNYRRAAPGAPWLIATYSVPESRRRVRDRLRRVLIREGFGTPSRGVWLIPAHHESDIAATLVAEGFSGMFDLFAGAPTGPTDEEEMIARGWDLGRLHRGRIRLARESAAVIQRWPMSRTDDQAAYVDFTQFVDRWRPLAYHDPGIPSLHLPADPALIEESFGRVRARLEQPARRFVANVLAVTS